MPHLRHYCAMFIAYLWTMFATPTPMPLRYQDDDLHPSHAATVLFVYVIPSHVLYLCHNNAIFMPCLCTMYATHMPLWCHIYVILMDCVCSTHVSMVTCFCHTFRPCMPHQPHNNAMIMSCPLALSHTLWLCMPHTPHNNAMIMSCPLALSHTLWLCMPHTPHYDATSMSYSWTVCAAHMSLWWHVFVILSDLVCRTNPTIMPWLCHGSHALWL